MGGCEVATLLQATRADFSTPSRRIQRPGPRSASYTPCRAGAVPVAVNAGPSGHGIRTTGAIHVEGSRGSTPRTCSCSSIACIHARTMSGATALRITTNPLGVKSVVDTAVSLLWRLPNAAGHMPTRRSVLHGAINNGSVRGPLCLANWTLPASRSNLPRMGLDI